MSLPPTELRERVSIRRDRDTYDYVGSSTREAVLAALPGEFEFDGRRVLDFGCGAGRGMRYFVAEAERCEFLGCDVDEASIEWMRRNMVPPFEVFANGHEPPLPLEAGSLDLVMAISVFTHLADSWSRWLAEMHRVLKPGGLLFATFMGPGVWHRGVGGHNGQPYDQVGIHVEQPWNDFVAGHGPAVWHTQWWLREHWGRAFELLHSRGPRRSRRGPSSRRCATAGSCAGPSRPAAAGTG